MAPSADSGQDDRDGIPQASSASLARRRARRARPRGGVARPAKAAAGRPRRHRRTCRPGPAASTSTATERSRPRSRGCGARRPASRSCATSSIGRPTTARPASVATSTGCADTTATTSRCPRAWTRPAGPRVCAISSTTATGSSSAGPSNSALRSAVKRLRLTNLPVALTVSHGNHGWILTGFRATADPAATTAFRVTSVRVTGPLYGLQSKNGYDMAPNTKLTTAQLKRFFTPWKYAPKAMVWDGRYVSIQPVPKAAPAAAAAAPHAVPSPRARRRRRPAESAARSVVESESSRDRQRVAGPGRRGRREHRPGRGCRGRHRIGVIDGRGLHPSLDPARRRPGDLS